MPPPTHFPLFDDLREKFPDLAADLISVSAEQASIALTGPDIRPISTWQQTELRRLHLVPGLLFILFGVGVFAGILMHTSRLILGPAREPAVAWYPWRDTSLVVLAAILVGMIFLAARAPARPDSSRR